MSISNRTIAALAELQEREVPMPGQLYAEVDFNASDGYGETRSHSTLTTDLGRATTCTSIVATDEPPFMVFGPDEMHRPVLDIDLPVYVVPSSTPGHSHLYIDKPMTWLQYRTLLVALADAGIIERGYADASIDRGRTDVRLPWIKKRGT